MFAQVAEFGLLDAQLAVLLGVLRAADAEAAAAARPPGANTFNRPEATQPGLGSASFDALDANGDGAVSRQEFDAWAAQQQLLSSEGGGGEAQPAWQLGSAVDALVLSRIDADELDVVSRQV